MQLSMMNQLGLIFVDGFIIYYILRSIISKLGQKNRKLQVLLIGISSAIILSCHYMLFNNYLKQQNYFEFYRLDRAYTSDNLNKKARQIMSMYHPDKNRETTHDKFNEVMFMRNVLTDQYYSKLYDIFGEFTYVEQSKVKDYDNIKNSLALSSYINTISFYSVFFIVSIVLSYGQRFSKYRILSSFILLGLLLQDILYFSEADDNYDSTKTSARNIKFEVQRDIYDDYFPQYTIFERLQLIKVLCAGLLTCLRLYFDLLVAEPVNRFEDSLEKEIDTLYERVLKQTEVLRVNPNELNKDNKENNEKPSVVFNANVLLTNKESVLKIKELAFKHKEDIPKDKLAWLKKIFKALVFSLFLYQLYRHFTDEPNQRNVKNNQQNAQHHRQQQQQQQQNYEEDDYYQ